VRRRQQVTRGPAVTLGPVQGRVTCGLDLETASRGRDLGAAKEGQRHWLLEACWVPAAGRRQAGSRLVVTVSALLLLLLLLLITYYPQFTADSMVSLLCSMLSLPT